MQKQSQIKNTIYAAQYHQLKYLFPNCSKEENKSHTKEPTFEKWGFNEKEVRRMGQNQKSIRQKQQQDQEEEQMRRYV